MKRIRNRVGQVSLLLAIVGVTLSGDLACGGGSATSNGNGQGGGDPALIGTWSGNEVGDTSTVWTFVIDATTMTVASSGVEEYAGTYTADPTSNPKRLTALITSCPFTAYIGKTSNGIYQVEGNGPSTLTFAGNEPGNPAVPTSFTPSETRVFVLTKQ